MSELPPVLGSRAAVRLLLPTMAAALAGCPPCVYPLRPRPDLIPQPAAAAVSQNGAQVDLRAPGPVLRLSRMELLPGGLYATADFVDRREPLRLFPREACVTTASGRRLELCGLDYPDGAGTRLTVSGSPALLPDSYALAPPVPWVSLRFDAAGQCASQQPAARRAISEELLGAPVTLHLDGLQPGARRVAVAYPFRLDCEALRERYPLPCFHPPVRAALRNCES